MSDTTLIGRYRTPRVKPGHFISDAVAGEVQVDGITEDVPIPWPYIARVGTQKTLILCADLTKAVNRESVAAVAYHWGVSRWTVRRWRRALGVGRWTEGTKRIWATNADKLHRRRKEVSPSAVASGSGPRSSLVP